MKRILLLLVPALLAADSFDAGAVFLLIFPGARATGMGAAFSAIADDATASYFNPAAVARFTHPEFTLIHSPWLPDLAPDMFYDFLGGVYILPENRGVVGGHIIYLNLGKVEIQEPAPAAWNPFSVALQLTYARTLHPRLHAGVGGKIIYDFLAPEDVLRAIFQSNVAGGNAASVALDAGILYEGPYNTSFAASLHNIGPSLRYTSLDTTGTPLPALLRLGMGVDTALNELFRIRLAVDLHKVIVNILEDYKNWGVDTILKDTWVSAGLEVQYGKFVALRAGYFLDETGFRKGFTWGGGIQFGNFAVDFADDRDIYSFNATRNWRIQISYRMNAPSRDSSPASPRPPTPERP